MDAQPKKRLSPLTLVLIIIIVLLLAVAVFLAVSKLGAEKEPEAESLGNPSTPLIGYEEGVTVVDDQDALQKAVDDMYEKAKEEGVPIEYQNGASSTDGENFSCYIANPAKADYDIFLTIFSDAELTDQLYLSTLIPPGSAKREIKLDRPLSPGTHSVYLVYTQVEDDHATIHQQVVVTMDFTVTT